MSDLKAAQEKESNKSEQILEIPRHMKLIKHAQNSQMNQALGKQKREKLVDGEPKKGDIVHIGMAKVNQTKV